MQILCELLIGVHEMLLMHAQALADRDVTHQQEVAELQEQLSIQQQAARDLKASMQMKIDGELTLLTRSASTNLLIPKAHTPETSKFRSRIV